MSNKKRSVILIAAATVILLLGLLILITGEFIFSAALHIFTRLLCVIAIIWVIRKSFREQVSHSINKVSALCGGVLALDLAVVDGVRFVLSHGESTVLLLPVCVPLSFTDIL